MVRGWEEFVGPKEEVDDIIELDVPPSEAGAFDSS
jgi:hypothetical protein